MFAFSNSLPTPLKNRDEMDQRPTQHQQVPPQVKEVSEIKQQAVEEALGLRGIARGQTPERIEFENAVDAMSEGEQSEEHIIDENEWTGRNFGSETEDSGSDYSSTDSSDSESDSDLYEEASGSPLDAQTLQLANEWIGKQKIQDSDEDDFYDSSDDDDADSQTEGEDQVRAREIRMQEVKLTPLAYPTTDTETEVSTDLHSFVSLVVVDFNFI